MFCKYVKPAGHKKVNDQTFPESLIKTLESSFENKELEGNPPDLVYLAEKHIFNPLHSHENEATKTPELQSADLQLCTCTFYVYHQCSCSEQ